MNDSATAKLLADLADQYWQFEIHEFPFAAIVAGDETVGDVLFRDSLEDFDRKASRAGALLARLVQIPASDLDAQDRATYDLMHRELRNICDSHALKAHMRPSLFPAGPDFNLRYFANGATAHSIADAERYLGRLRSIASYINDLQGCLEAGRDAGFRYPNFVIDKTVDAMRAGFPGSAEKSPLMGPFHMSMLADSPRIKAMASQAGTLIEKEVMPAQSRFADFLANDLMQSGRDSIACSDDHMGEEYYKFLVHNFTSLDMSPEDVHELGLEEVARLSEQMATIAADAGFAGNVSAYGEFLNTDEQFVAPDTETHQRDVRAICKEIDSHIPAYFRRIPRITYTVKCISPDLSANMPPAYAQPSPADNSAPGVFWLSGIPARCPTWFYTSLALHEAWPGHLMQIALMQENESLPRFRRNGALKYTACIEGWAMYCENLGIDMGMYKTPHDHFGRLLFEMWRSVRLVVDTGIHSMGWTREEALAYAVERVAIPRQTLEGEIDRYIALPGQALAYQPGNLKFRELRHRAEQRLGEKFDIREFHDQLISSGPVTLPVLDTLVENWLGQQAA